MKITLFIPTLNEIEGMKVIMPQIEHLYGKLFNQILVVDGKSTDGTIEFAKARGYDLHIQTKKGIRHAYIESFPKITSEYVLTFSPDGNSVIEDIPKIINLLKEGYDMVIASRYAEGAKSDDDDLITSFGNWFFTKSINLFHGGRYTDAMVIYRAYKTKMFYDLDLHLEESYAPEKIFRTVIGCEPLLSIRAAKAGLKIGEIASDEPKRIGGERKLQILRWGGAYYLQILKEIFYWKPKKNVT